MDIFIIYMVISSIIGCLLALLIIKLIKIVIGFFINILKNRKLLKDKKEFGFCQRIKDPYPKPNEQVITIPKSK